MANPSQKRAVRNYRDRLAGRGLARFEVLGLNSDRELIRLLAKRLAEDDAAAAHLRADVGRSVGREQPKRGGVLAALRRSPMVGAELDLTRTFETGRDVDL